MVITVGIGRIACTDQSVPLQMLGLGSCVGVVLFTKDHNFIGAVHVMLPDLQQPLPAQPIFGKQQEENNLQVAVYTPPLSEIEHKKWAVWKAPRTDIPMHYDKGAMMVLPEISKEGAEQFIASAFETRSAEVGITRVIDIMKAYGYTPSHAVIAGGSHMFETNKLKVGERNIEAVHAILEKFNIPIREKDTGGNSGRSLTVDLAAKKMSIRSKEYTKDLYTW